MAKDDAKKHIRARQRLTAITGRLDGLVVEKFLALDDVRRDSLLLTYGSLFGAKRAAWVTVALPRWRHHPETISGMVAARLLYVLPAFLTADEVAALQQKWQNSWSLTHASPMTGLAGRVQMLRICEGNQKMADEILLALGQRRLCKLPGAISTVLPVAPAHQPARLIPPAAPNAAEQIAPRIAPSEPKIAAPVSPPLQTAPRQNNPTVWCTIVFLAVLVAFVLVAVGMHTAPPAVPVGQSPGSPTPVLTLPTPSKVESWSLSRQRAIAQYPEVANPVSSLGRAVRQELEDLQKANSTELQSPDAPMTVTRRVAERLAQHPVAQAVEINFVQKQSRFDPHSRIEFVGGYNADGTIWRLPLADAVTGVQVGKYAFYVAQGGSRVAVVVSTSREGNLFLKTVADSKSANNLLSLPTFP